MKAVKLKPAIVLILGTVMGAILSVVQIALYIFFEVNPWSSAFLKILTWNIGLVSELMFRGALPSHEGDQIQALEGLAYAVLFGTVLNTFFLFCVWLLAKKILLRSDLLAH